MKTDNTPPQHPKNKLNKHGWRYLIGMIIWPFFQLGLFLAIARQADIFQMWLCFAANCLFVPIGTWVVARYNPEILNYRGLRRKEGIKTWDKILIRLFGLFGFHLPIIIAAMDLGKHHWTTLPPAVSVSAILLLFAGRALFVWGMCVNDFFDTMVHIQDDRGQKVITTGPYQYVRHPGYTGCILWILSIPLILSSAVALIPALIGCALLITRTYLEDTMLKNELEGYTEYANRVRYRLVIGIW